MPREAGAHLRERIPAPFPRGPGGQHSLRDPRGAGLCEVHGRREDGFLRESSFSRFDPKMQSNSHIPLHHTCLKGRGANGRLCTPKSRRPLTQPGDFLTDLTHLQVNLVAALFLFYILQSSQQASRIFSCFLSPQQDSEKMKRLREAVKAQTDYTIAVSVSRYTSLK